MPSFTPPRTREAIAPLLRFLIAFLALFMLSLPLAGQKQCLYWADCAPLVSFCATFGEVPCGQDCICGGSSSPPPTLSATDPNYWPVNTVSKDGAFTGPGFISQNGTDVVVTNAPDLIFTVIIPPSTDGSDNTQIVEFELSDVSSLIGYATNACFKPDCSSDLDTGPDFIFEKQDKFDAPTEKGMKIRTSNKVQKIKVTVTSRDYGGTATLQATLDPDGNNGGPISTVVQNPDGSTQDYTNIPIDKDGNGIADSWEAQYGGTLDPQSDNDGDGFPAFDEYRGFVVLDQNSGDKKLVRTDPLQMQDLFYWDAGNFINDGNTNHLANIFGAQTQNFIALHQVNAQQAQATKPNDPTAPLNPLNSNSPYLSPSLQGFALVYVWDDSLTPKGTLGVSCDPNTLPTSPAFADCYRNDGQHPIHIAVSAIDSIASKYWSGDSSQYASVLLDDVVAHETGHKLGLWHHVRTADIISLDKDQIKDLPANLPFGSFIEKKDKTQVSIEEYVYELLGADFKNNGKLMINEVPVNDCTNLGNNGPYFILHGIDGQTPYHGEVQLPYWPIQIGITRYVAVDTILIKSQDGEIMSWTPELDNIDDSDWQFGPDLSGMCLQADGCDKPLPTGKCNQ